MAKGACKIVGEYVSVYSITHIELHSSMKKFCYFSASNASFADHVSRRAITDAAWLAFLAKLAFSKDMFLESFTAIMYDIMLFSLISDREEVILDLVRLISFSFE